MDQEQLDSTVKDFFEYQNTKKKIQTVDSLIKREQSREGTKTASSIERLKECVKGWVEATNELSEQQIESDDLEFEQIPIISQIKELTRGIFDSTISKPDIKDVKEFSSIIQIIKISKSRGIAIL